MKKRIIALFLAACLVTGGEGSMAVHAAATEEDVILEQADFPSQESLEQEMDIQDMEGEDGLQEESVEDSEILMPEEVEEDGEILMPEEVGELRMPKEQGERADGTQAEGTDEELRVEEVQRGAVSLSPETAESIQLDKQYNGTITESVPVHFYKFTLPQSGVLTINARSEEINRLYYNVDHSWDLDTGWYTYSNYNSTTGMNSAEINWRLTAGTYYLGIGEGYDNNDDSFGNGEITAGSFRFSLSLDGVGESFKEKDGGSNNSIATASKISLNKTYIGQIAVNDEEDYFQFTLSGPALLTLSMPVLTDGNIDYGIYGKNGEKICSSYLYQGGDTRSYHLTKGTYYLRLSQRYQRMYKFKLTAKNVAETFPDVDGEGNNTLAKANKISLGKTYKGQIAENDDVDYFTFTIGKTQKMGLTTVSGEYLEYSVYDYNGNLKWEEYGEDDSFTLELSKGTYYLGVHRGDHTLGAYSFRLAAYQPISAQISSLENTSKGVKLTWNSVSGATGYKIYRRLGKGGYKLIKTLKKGSTVSYTDKTAKNKKSYTYKLKTVEKSYSSVYSTAKSVYCLKGKSAVKGLSKASGGFRVKIKKVSGATGYEVQYSTNSSFSYASAAKTKKTSVKVNAYSSSYYKYTYYVRVRTYKKVGKKIYYGPWSAKKWITI